MVYVPPGRGSRKCRHQWFDAWNWIANRVIAAAGAPRVSVGRGEVAIDPHIHTMFSHCSISRPDRIILHAAKLGLGGVAIMDHGDIQGAADAVRCAEDFQQRGIIPRDFLVIPGVEVYSAAGHIGALFVEQKIPYDQSAEATVKAIHDAGGLAVAPHPFYRPGVGRVVFDVAFDAMDVVSGSILAPGPAETNRRLCEDPRLANVAKIGSSDAHYVSAIGLCYTVLEMAEPTLEAARQAMVERRTRPVSSEACARLARLVSVIPRFRRRGAQG